MFGYFVLQFSSAKNVVPHVCLKLFHPIHFEIHIIQSCCNIVIKCYYDRLNSKGWCIFVMFSICFLSLNFYYSIFMIHSITCSWVILLTVDSPWKVNIRCSQMLGQTMKMSEYTYLTSLPNFSNTCKNQFDGVRNSDPI